MERLADEEWRRISNEALVAESTVRTLEKKAASSMPKKVYLEYRAKCTQETLTRAEMEIADTLEDECHYRELIDVSHGEVNHARKQRDRADRVHKEVSTAFLKYVLQCRTGRHQERSLLQTTRVVPSKQCVELVIPSETV